MNCKYLRLALSVLWCVATAAGSVNEAYAQQDCAMGLQRKSNLLKEHLFGGAPSTGAVLVCRAYVTQYDPDHRVPRWAAWHAEASYLDAPSRKGKFATFRKDASIAKPVVTSGFDDAMEEFDYARGHIVSYFIAGGDRNKNGKKATTDPDDACTVFEINYMSNIFGRAFIEKSDEALAIRDEFYVVVVDQIGNGSRNSCSAGIGKQPRTR